MSNEAAAQDELIVRFARVTHSGGRESNQDALASAYQDGLACGVVSDGVGGHSGGEIASAIVVDAVVKRFLLESSFSQRALQSYIDYASEQIAQRKASQASLQQMSATLAVVLLDPKSRMALWAHKGDTRVYLFRHNKILSVTKDHSLVQKLVDAGYCRAEDLPAHPQRSVLWAAIGAENSSNSSNSMTAQTLEAGDVFLVCTDGFWEWLTEQDIESTLGATASLEAWLISLQSLVESRAAMSLSAYDNYTALAIACERPGLS